MKLYNYFRSSASYRVRIALELKGLAYDYVAVNLVQGEQRKAPYADWVADPLVPMLEVDGVRLTQSMAIIEYLDETHPATPLLPADALARAQVRALAQSIACEIHPLNNLRVLKYLVNELGQDEAAKLSWYRHWVSQGLAHFENQLQTLAAQRTASGQAPSRYCHGDVPTLADCCLIPQVYNAQRFEVSLDGLPLIQKVIQACMALPAFERAQPHNCPDATS